MTLDGNVGRVVCACEYIFTNYFNEY